MRRTGPRLAVSPCIMATSPTVLASASTSSPPSVAPAPDPTRFPIVSVLLAVVVSAAVAALGVGGGMYYLARTGQLPSFSSATHKPEVVPSPKTHVMVLEPLLVNLADAGGSSYLRVALTLRVADPADKKGPASQEKAKDDASTSETVAPVRDTLLAVLGRQTSDELLTVDGKEHLKTALKTALAERNSSLKVTDVYFTDFLVQR